MNEVAPNAAVADAATLKSQVPASLPEVGRVTVSLLASTPVASAHVMLCPVSGCVAACAHGEALPGSHLETARRSENDVGVAADIDREGACGCVAACRCESHRESRVALQACSQSVYRIHREGAAVVGLAGVLRVTEVSFVLSRLWRLRRSL